MNSIQSNLKSEPFGTVFQMAAKSFKNITIANVLYTIVVMVLILPVFFVVFGMEPQRFLELMEISDPIQRQMVAQELFADQFSGIDPSSFLILGLVCIVILVIASWFGNLCFISVGATVRNRKLSFGELFQKSFNMNVIWLLLASFVLLIIYSIGIGLLSGLSAFLDNSVLIILIGGFALMVFLMRFIIVFPAIVNGNMSVGGAMKHSLAKISFLRALKYLGVSILVAIALVVVMALLGMVQAALMLIPVIGFVLYLIVSLGIGGFMNSWMVSILTGIYYRHLDEELSDGGIDLEDHLIL